MLLGVFSPIVNAEELNHYSVQFHALDNHGSYSVAGSYVSGTGLVSFGDEQNVVSTTLNSQSQFVYNFYVGSEDGSPVVESGRYFDFGLYDFVLFAELGSPSFEFIHLKKFDTIYLVARYTDGTTEIVYDCHEYMPPTNQDGNNNIEFKGITAKKTIQDFWVQFIYFPYNRLGLQGKQSYKLGMQHMGGIQVKIESEEVSVSKGILGKLGDLFNSITDGFKNIGNWFAELPGKLWAVISEGLKNLFVPDSAYLATYKDKWDELLSSRFGAVYQVCDIITNSFTDIELSDESNTIQFPLVSLPVGSGETFSFGGYQIQIVPSGFEFLASSLKMIVAIVCTFAFINGLMKRYEEIMGVEK